MDKINLKLGSINKQIATERIWYCNLNVRANHWKWRRTGKKLNLNKQTNGNGKENLILCGNLNACANQWK